MGHGSCLLLELKEYTIFCHEVCAPVYGTHPCFWPKHLGKNIFHFNFLKDKRFIQSGEKPEYLIF